MFTDSSPPIPPGWTSHDLSARTVVRRHVGNLAPALRDVYGDEAFAKLVSILGADESYPELTQKPSFVQVPQLVVNDLVTPLTPRVENGVKVFDLTASVIRWPILAGQTVEAYAFNNQVPGPMLRVTEGDRVRINVTNSLPESTTVHWHGIILPIEMDGPAHITQEPIERYGSVDASFRDPSGNGWKLVQGR